MKTKAIMAFDPLETGSVKCPCVFSEKNEKNLFHLKYSRFTFITHHLIRTCGFCSVPCQGRTDVYSAERQKKISSHF